MKKNKIQKDLFSEETNDLFPGDFDWPNQTYHPDTIPGCNRSLRKFIKKDFKNSEHATLIAGFASFGEFVKLISDKDFNPNECRILLGSEPSQTKIPLGTPLSRFNEQARRFWQNEGYSILLSGKTILAKEKLKSSSYQVRAFTHTEKLLHAKIYISDTAVITGSSNFTPGGLSNNFESNNRFEFDGYGKKFANEMKLKANNFWRMGVDYKEEFLKLLDQLIQFVSWQEALARGCAEILDGRWATIYQKPYFRDSAELWPIQRQGVAQALYVLERQACCLISDAPGAGKTKLGMYCIRALQEVIHRCGRNRRGMTTIVCPPKVIGNWEKEESEAQCNAKIISHGHLQTKNEDDRLKDIITKSQTLLIDEAHNFFANSNRTQAVSHTLCDYTVLLTATPINRSVKDLVSIAKLLGVDNLSDDTIEALERVVKQRNPHSVNESHINKLRKELQKFIIRRTQQMIKKEINENPQEYKNSLGNNCNYPDYDSLYYHPEATAKDIAIAKQIEELASELNGLIYFPKILENKFIADERYIDSLLNCSKALAKYMLMSSLRSSKVVLIKHCLGPKHLKRFNIKSSDVSQGAYDSVFKKLNIHNKTLPENKHNYQIPDWMSSKEEWVKSLDREQNIYGKIAKLAAKMSDAREISKAKFLRGLVEKDDLPVLAFDHHVDSLAYIAYHYEKLYGNEAIVITGKSSTKYVDEITRRLSNKSNEAGSVILLSDAMSEGVNLQRAKHLVHLDHPSTVRIAEQRSYRIIRVDSEHQSVQIHWPMDQKEFQLKTDKKLHYRNDVVGALIGKNLQLPDDNADNLDEFVNEFNKALLTGDKDMEFRDAFQSVRDLVSGEDALIDRKVYLNYQSTADDVQQRIYSRVAVVESHQDNWIYFCLKGSEFHSPIWIFLESENSNISTDLDLICPLLRKRLTPDTAPLPPELQKNYFDSTLKKFVERLNGASFDLLSNRKKKALILLHDVLENYLSTNTYGKDHSQGLEDVLILLEEQKSDIDWNNFADGWLDYLRPLHQLHDKQNKKKIFRLKDLKKPLTDKPISIDELEDVFRKSIRTDEPIDYRVVSFIVGINPRKN